jgi:tetratricopeptide (TPR) repeat protein
MDAQTQSTDYYIKSIEWLHARRKPLMIAAAAVLVIGLAWTFIAMHKAQEEADANTRFYSIPVDSLGSAAAPSTSLLGVTREYSGTPAGEYAQVLAAKDLFLEGKYPEAFRQFTAFIANYPDSTLIPQAKVGLAACLEAEGKANEAIQEYHKIILTYPSEMSIVSPAKLTMARLYEEIGKPQEALSYYAELARMLSQNQNDIWAQEARERAMLLLSQHPELLSALTNAAPAAPSMPQMGHPAGSPPTGTASAPQASPANAASGAQSLKLLPVPGASSNSTPKP